MCLKIPKYYNQAKNAVAFFGLTGFVILFLFICLPVYSYEAKITKDKINVRLDSTVMSPSLGYLNRNERVTVAEEQFDWYKVILPKRFSCYIAAEFLKKIDDNKVEVIGTEVNMRDLPSLSSYVIGTVDKETVLFYREKVNGWYRVRGYPYIYGWVNKNFIQKIEAPVVAEGTIFSYSNKNCEANYILKNNEKTYLLNIKSEDNKKFLNKKVKIEARPIKGNCLYFKVQKISPIK